MRNCLLISTEKDARINAKFTKPGNFLFLALFIFIVSIAVKLITMPGLTGIIAV